MAHLTHQVSAGDRVRTMQPVDRWRAGSIGTIQTALGAGCMLDVLLAGYRAPLLIYHEQLQITHRSKQ
jgi:hypothetical protein